MIASRFGRSLTVALSAVAFLVVTTVPTFAAEPGGDSPAAVAERMKRANENEDIVELMACLAPSGRVEMAQMMYLTSTMLVGFAMMGAEMGGAMAEGMAEGLGEDLTSEQRAEMEGAKQEALASAKVLTDSYNKLVARYGLPQMVEGEEPPDVDLDSIFQGIDHAAFMKDVIAFMDSIPGGEKPEPATPPTPSGKLVMTDLKLDGDSATAIVDGQDMKFVRVDGRWYIDGPPGGP